MNEIWVKWTLSMLIGIYLVLHMLEVYSNWKRNKEFSRYIKELKEARNMEERWED